MIACVSAAPFKGMLELGYVVASNELRVHNPISPREKGLRHHLEITCYFRISHMFPKKRMV